MTKLSRSIIVAGFIATGAVAGCAGNVTTAVRPCPCADGNICCGSGVCAADESACGAATAALSAQASGDWVGYIENFTSIPFPSGSDDVKLSLTVQSDGSLGGTLTLGMGTPPSPPTNPDIAWPPSDQMTMPFFAKLSLMEGYNYQVGSPKWEALRLRGGFATAEPWRAWCALQTPVRVSQDVEGVYGCAPNVGGGMSNGECTLATDPPQPIDCGKWSLCSQPDNPCTCTATSCSSAKSSDNTFDISLDGDRGNGSISLPGQGGMYNIRLLRQ